MENWNPIVSPSVIANMNVAHERRSKGVGIIDYDVFRIKGICTAVHAHPCLQRIYGDIAIVPIGKTRKEMLLVAHVPINASDHLIVVAANAGISHVIIDIRETSSGDIRGRPQSL